MEKTEIRKLIAIYDCTTIFNLSSPEWDALTNHFELDMVKEILFRVAECTAESSNEEIIGLQLEVLNKISGAYSSMNFNGNWECTECYEHDTELSLLIKAGAFLLEKSTVVPTTDDKTTDYLALQQLVSDYSSSCQQMRGFLANAQERSKDDYNLLNLVNSLNEELARTKKELETHKTNEKALRTENEQLKMQQKELDQMSKKLVQKAEHEDLLKVVQTYMNVSKRKNVKKRGYIKITILELVQVARLTLPEDMQKELENFDDDNSDVPQIGEYVATKIVENEIKNVEAGGTGVVKQSHKE